MNIQLSPKQIVSELDKFIIGQEEAKKAVAIALRNRYRRSKLSSDIREENYEQISNSILNYDEGKKFITAPWELSDCYLYITNVSGTVVVSD